MHGAEPMTRNYIRISPDLVEEKERDGYSEAAIGAFVKLFCEAEKQSPRGKFKSLAILRAHLGRSARWVPFFLGQNDLALLSDGRYSVVGWDEWQEGNWQVAERMKRVREAQADRNSHRNADRHIYKEGGVTPITSQTVTAPSRVEAVSGERLAKASEVTVPAATPLPSLPARNHAIENGYSDAVKEPDEELVNLVNGISDVLGRVLSGQEISACVAVLNEYAYMTARDLVERAKDHQETCADKGYPPARTVAGFADTWRRQNDWNADHGVSKASKQVGGRYQGLASVGDLLKPKEAI